MLQMNDYKLTYFSSIFYVISSDQHKISFGTTSPPDMSIIFFLQFFKQILAKLIIISFHRKTLATFFFSSLLPPKQFPPCIPANPPICFPTYSFQSPKPIIVFLLSLLSELCISFAQFFLPRFQFYPQLPTLVFDYLHQKILFRVLSSLLSQCSIHTLLSVSKSLQTFVPFPHILPTF